MQPTDPASDIRQILADAAWLPHGYVASTRSLRFIHAPRETQRDVPFIDDRCLAGAPHSQPIPITQLPPYAIQRAAGPMHFIFHTAFCCSTLLTRAFDAPGVSMGLKEPDILVSLANAPASARCDRAAAAMRLSLDLLSRPLAPGETQIIKPSNAANMLAGEILLTRGDAKAIILHSGLDDFLRSIAQRGLQGRLFARSLFMHFAREAPLPTGYTAHDLMQQSDLQIAAQAWLMQAHYLAQTAQRFGPARVRMLSSSTLLRDPAAALIEVAGFFDLHAQPDYWRAVAAGPVFTHHAKSPNRAFDAAARDAAHLDARATHGEEVEAVSRWAAALARHCRVPIALDDTLGAESTPTPVGPPHGWLEEHRFSTAAQLAIA